MDKIQEAFNSWYNGRIYKEKYFDDVAENAFYAGYLAGQESCKYCGSCKWWRWDDGLREYTCGNKEVCKYAGGEAMSLCMCDAVDGKDCDKWEAR